jgi:cellulose synthase/poly-beta-1,6-N-acetylglucosamine synthase-like glycosyltransferase
MLFFTIERNTIKSYNYNNNPPVSVIIAAKNEADNLSKYLIYILTQQYPEFEVIIAVNNTTDHTIQLLKQLQQHYAHLRWVEIQNIPENTSPKKYALSQAIQQAKYNHLLFTDADCFPNSNLWIQKMIQPFANSKTEVVLGYSPYQQKKGLLNSFIQYETVFTAIQYLGLAWLGMPYMGVGRNLAYKKSLFEKYTFDTHTHILSGDDDLLVNQAGNKTNTAIQVNREAWVYSIPKKSWKEWYTQKNRHISTGKYYKKIHLFVLGILSFLNFILPFLPFLYFLIQEKFYIFASPLVFVYSYTIVVFKKYHIRIKSAHFILLSYLYSMYQAVFSIKGIFSKKHKTW